MRKEKNTRSKTCVFACLLALLNEISGPCALRSRPDESIPCFSSCICAGRRRKNENKKGGWWWWWHVLLENYVTLVPGIRMIHKTKRHVADSIATLARLSNSLAVHIRTVPVKTWNPLHPAPRASAALCYSDSFFLDGVGNNTPTLRTTGFFFRRLVPWPLFL